MRTRAPAERLGASAATTATRCAAVLCTCAALLLSSCGGGSDGAGRNAPTYAIGGIIAGLDEGYVDLGNGLEQMRIEANPNGLALDEAFTLTTRLPAGATYDLRILNDTQTQFALQCDVINGQGTMPAGDVGNVLVRCARVKSLRLLAGKIPLESPARDGLATDARFNFPTGITVDALGNLLLADGENHTIRRITPAGVVSTIAGTAGQGGAVDGAGADARFLSPAGVAVDGAGTLYVADRGNSTIRRVTVSGVVTTLAGSAGLTGTADGAGAAARFNLPRGVAVDAAGNVYVADTRNHTIRRITPAGAVTTLAGSAGQPGNTDGTGSAARFNRPAAIAIDAAGILWVKHFGEADGGNNTIRRVTPAGEVTTFVAGVGGAEEGGLAFDASGNLYVTDLTAVRKITPAGVVSMLATNGDTTTFSFINGVTVDAAANVYVTDGGRNLIQRISQAGVVTPVAGATGDNGSIDGAGGDARFDLPFDIALDAAGNLFVADFWNHTIRRVTPAGIVSTYAGSARQPGSVDGAAFDARFENPNAIAVDPAGNVYVSDGANNSIRRVTPAGVVANFAGSATQAGFADGTGANARFNRIADIASDTAGNLYVADFENKVLRHITPAGVVTTLAGSPGLGGFVDGTGAAARFDRISELAVDTGGNAYVVDGNTVRLVTAGGVVTTLAGSPVEAGSTNGPGALARFNGIGGIAVDAGGSVYVSEPFDSSIRVLRRNASGTYDVSLLHGTPFAVSPRLGPLPTPIGLPRALAVNPKRLHFTSSHAVLFIDR